MLLISASAVFAEEVIIELPKHDVILNGYTIENDQEKYPFIVYKGITYLPMTWDFSKALGLNLTWSNEDGLGLLESSGANAYVPKNLGEFKRSNTATIITDDVRINTKLIDHGLLDYPILNYNYITYFPMTWSFMVTEFGLAYKWDSDIGFSIGIKDDVTMIYPAPNKITKKYQVKDIPLGYEGITDDNLNVQHSEHSIGVYVEYLNNTDMNNKYYDLKVNYYNQDDQLITGVINIAKRYYKGFEAHYGKKDYDSTNFFDAGKTKSFEVEISVYEPSVVATMNYMLKQTIETEIVSINDIDYKNIKDHYSYMKRERLNFVPQTDAPIDQVYIGLKERIKCYYDENDFYQSYSAYSDSYQNNFDENYGFFSVNSFDDIQPSEHILWDTDYMLDGEIVESYVGDAILLFDNMFNLKKILLIEENMNSRNK